MDHPRYFLKEKEYEALEKHYKLTYSCASSDDFDRALKGIKPEEREKVAKFYKKLRGYGYYPQSYGKVITGEVDGKLQYSANEEGIRWMYLKNNNPCKAPLIECRNIETAKRFLSDNLGWGDAPTVSWDDLQEEKERQDMITR